MSATIKVISVPKRDNATPLDVTVEAPDAGSGWIVKAAIPFTDAYGPAVAIVFDNTEPADAIQTFTIDLAPVANQSVTKRIFFPRAGVLSELAYYVDAKSASALGTVLFNATKGVTGAGDVVLTAADFNAEAMVDDTYTEFILTGTEANLAFAAGTFLEVQITSNNADMTAGTNLQIVGVFTLD